MITSDNTFKNLLFLSTLRKSYFMLLLHVATGNFPDKPYAKLHYYPGIIAGIFSVTGIRAWQTDREIRGMPRWKERTVYWASWVPIVIITGGLLLFNYMGCGKVVDKEVETLNEKSDETSLEKTTTEQIILPAEK